MSDATPGHPLHDRAVRLLPPGQGAAHRARGELRGGEPGQGPGRPSRARGHHRADDVPAGAGGRALGRRLPRAASRPTAPACWRSCSTPSANGGPPEPRPPLAARADVGPPAGHAQLLDRRAAARAGLALAHVDEEAVLEVPSRAVGVAVVVDRGALGVDPQLERLHHRVAQRLDLRPASGCRPGAAGGSGHGRAPRRRRCSPRPPPAPG